jgi:hypothetical protein
VDWNKLWQAIRQTYGFSYWLLAIGYWLLAIGILGADGSRDGVPPN